MTPWQQRADALTRRMAEDMQLRNLSQKTIDAYTYHVGRFARFIHENGGRSVDEATPEDVRSFQLHLIEVRKVGWSSFNQAVCGLRFLYRTTVPRSWHVEMIPFGKRPKKLPEVLSGQEVNALLSCGISLNDALGAERERVGWPGRLAGSRSDKRLLHPRPTAAGCRRECSVPMVNRPVPAAPDQLWSGHPAGVSKTLGTGLRFSGKSMHCPVGDGWCLRSGNPVASNICRTLSRTGTGLDPLRASDWRRIRSLRLVAVLHRSVRRCPVNVDSNRRQAHWPKVSTDRERTTWHSGLSIIRPEPNV